MSTAIFPSTVTATQEQLDVLLAELLPPQGQWSEEAYLWLTDHTTRLIEFTDGYLEVLPMPTDEHQTLVLWLYEMLVAFLRPRGGKVLVAPLRLKIRDGKYREPDLLLVRSAQDPRRQNRFWLGADVVVEVVSPDKPERDLIDKRNEYATAQIPEYWIVHPQRETITVLVLQGQAYNEHGMFGRGTMATSALLPGFCVSVDALLDAE
ncbi:MAG: Uma2 family endonuclease [Candidatus Tectomicrobia bacterium]|uniref:Uma2 family endonuclease n=1 Tax=Tectimicrobiota bacterium TaxID=2528274 RepID=A0A938B0J2_UNCTE|nr:Uma2 family endonuclease [Candidatus Tectomicrobia bacterium]